MSPRTLSRWCREHLDESPAELVRRIRLDEARRLLEETAAAAEGHQRARRPRRREHDVARFTRRLGVTPAGYRRRFGAPS